MSSNILQSRTGPLYLESSESTYMRADKPNFLNCAEASIEHQFMRTSAPAILIQGDTNKWELLKNPTKIEEIQEKKFIDRN